MSIGVPQLERAMARQRMAILFMLFLWLVFTVEFLKRGDQSVILRFPIGADFLVKLGHFLLLRLIGLPEGNAAE